MMTRDSFWHDFMKVLEDRVKNSLPEAGTEADMMAVVKNRFEHLFKEFLPYGY